MDIKSQFLALVDAELTEGLRTIEVEAGRAIAEASAAGRFNSGRRRFEVSEVYVRAVRRHRLEIFERWSRFVQPHLQAGNAAADALSGVAVDAYDRSISIIQRKHDGQLSDQESKGLRDSLPSRIAHERAALAAVTLLHAGLPQQATLPHITVNHSGTNSPVSIGSGSINQTINKIASMNELARALRELAAALCPANAAELLEVVEEAATEAERPTPNKLRVGSLLTGAATAVQTVGAAQPAWEAVRTVARAMGMIP
jgi:hypothetical protein